MRRHLPLPDHPTLRQERIVRRWEIRFTSGRIETVDGYRTRTEDGVLRIRTTHDTAYNDEWANYPLVNIESWKEIRR